MMTLQIFLFGSLRIQFANEQNKNNNLPQILRFPTQKVRSLFAYLVTYRTRTHSRRVLAELFWGDRPDEKAQRSLNTALWRLRRLLEPESALAGTYILTKGQNVRFNIDSPYWMDLEEFERNIAVLKRNVQLSREDCVQLEKAVELYRGDFLEGFYDDWCVLERERLRERYLETLYELVIAYKKQGEYNRAIPLAQKLAANDPLREEAHRELMHLYQLTGRRGAALQQYHNCQEILEQELGIEPTAETQQMYREVLRASTRVQATEPVVPLVSASPTDEWQVPAKTPFDDFGELPLVGRRDELAKLRSRVKSAAQGRGGLVLIQGEVGVGKSRLLRELADWARRERVEVLWGSGKQSPEVAPYGVWVEALRGGLTPQRISQLRQIVPGVWLREMSLLLPELTEIIPALPPRAGLGWEKERERLRESLSQYILGLGYIAPHLIILENMQWFALATHDIIRYITGRLRDAPILIIVSLCPEELNNRGVELAARVSDILDNLKRSSLVQTIHLERLSADETAWLVQMALGLQEEGPQLSQRLYRETEGNPFFVMETLKLLYEEGLLYRDERGRWQMPWDYGMSEYAELPVPHGIQKLVERRLQVLNSETRALLNLATVLGREFDFDRLWRASGRGEEEILVATDELLHHQLFEDTAAGYRFTHEKVRQVVYDNLGQTWQRLLHRRVGLALEQQALATTQELAYYFYMSEDWERAVRYCKLSGDKAKKIYANDEALIFYSQALESLDYLEADLNTEEELDDCRLKRFGILAQREELYDLQGHREAQQADLDTLMRLAQASNDEGYLAQVLNRQGDLFREMGQYPEAEKTTRRALKLWRGQDNQRGEAQELQQLGLIQQEVGNYNQALASYQAALDICHMVKDKRGEGDSLHGLAQTYWQLSDYERALQQGTAALKLRRAANNRAGEGETLSIIGVVYAELGNYHQALEYYTASLKIRQEIGYRYGEGVCYLNMGNVYSWLGDHGQALENFARSLIIFREIENRYAELSCLNNMGSVYEILGDYDRALKYCEEALEICRELGDRGSEGYILGSIGSICAAMQDYERAVRSLEWAIARFREVGSRYGEVKAIHNLGRVYLDLQQADLARGHFEQAYHISQELGLKADMVAVLSDWGYACAVLSDSETALEYSWRAIKMIKAGQKDVEQMQRVYFQHYRILDNEKRENREKYLQHAYDLIQERAKKISDAKLRRSFLENVSINRAIRQQYKNRELFGQIEIRLAKTGVPLGRPLQDDEYVTVTWTVDAGEEDAAFRHAEGKRALRQKRLLRLLAEAAEQGGEPTDDNLATALGVSVRTIERDIAALCERGHTITTRRRR